LPPSLTVRGKLSEIWRKAHTHTHTHTDAPEAEERAASEPKPSEPKPSGASDSPWNPGLNHTAGETGAGGKGGDGGGGGGGKPFGAFKNSLEELILRTARGGSKGGTCNGSQEEESSLEFRNKSLLLIDGWRMKGHCLLNLKDYGGAGDAFEAALLVSQKGGFAGAEEAEAQVRIGLGSLSLSRHAAQGICTHRHTQSHTHNHTHTHTHTHTHRYIHTYVHHVCVCMGPQCVFGGLVGRGRAGGWRMQQCSSEWPLR